MTSNEQKTTKKKVDKMSQAQKEQVLSIKDVTKYIDVGARVIYAALQSGDLAGRNLGGSKGWVTTRTAVLDWIESGNISDVDSSTEVGE